GPPRFLAVAPLGGEEGRRLGFRVHVGQLNGALGTEHSVPDGHLRQHERALTTGLPVALKSNVHELHGTNGPAVHHETGGASEVTAILLVAGVDNRAREVVGLDVVNPSNALDAARGNRTSAGVVLVDVVL